MVHRPRLSLPKRILRRGHKQADSSDSHAPASPFQAMAAPGQEPLGRLRVQVFAGRDLVARDRSGTSDPYLVLKAAHCDRIQTEAISRTINPVWGAMPPDFKAVPEAKAVSSEAVLELETYADTLTQQVIEIVLWDKDRFSKNDYMGEVNLDLEAWFDNLQEDALMFNNPKNQPRWHPVSSTRRRQEGSGAILCKIGFVNTAQSISGEQELSAVVKQALQDKRNLGRLSRTERVLTAPPMESVGTIQKRSGPVAVGDAKESLAYQYELPGDSSSDSGEDEDDETDRSSVSDSEGDFLPAPEVGHDGNNAVYFDAPEQLPGLVVTPHEESGAQLGAPDHLAQPDGTPASPPNAVAAAAGKGRRLGMPFFKRTNSTRSTASVASDITEAAPDSSATSEAPSSSSNKKNRFKTPRRLSSKSASTSPEQSTLELNNASAADVSGQRTKRKRKGKKGKGFEFGKSDVVGVCFLEVQSASDLPRWKAATRLTFDMDPFVVISFGKRVFRTRVLRHTLNPKWDERLFFHVRSHETAFNMQLNVYDWDKVSSNDFVGTASTDLKFLVDHSPVAAENGLYACDGKGFLLNDHFQDRELKIEVPKLPDREQSQHPTLKVRAKYVPYEALRQQFWRQYMQSFDTDGDGIFSEVELFAMLDSLGSTLSSETLDSFFARFGKSRDGDSLTCDQVVACLESELSRSEHRKRPVAAASGVTTPSEVPSLADNAGGVGFTGNHSADPERNKKLAPTLMPAPPQMESRDEVVAEASSSTDTSLNDYATGPSRGQSEDAERVINIKECPLCHKSKLNKRSKVDIITHLAICASQDWAHMGSLMVSNFVTGEQAHRKWLGKAIARVTKGAYSLGADSGNILVQNRMTGQLLEEKMQIYVRLGIRLGYRGMTGTVEGGRVRRLFASMSMKQGRKFDSPDSVEEIAPFIAFHGLDMGEVKDPLDSFKTFNQFFYRKLKDDARPVAGPQDPNTLVSSADCRLMAFQTIDDAKRIWIKGKEFSIARMLGDKYGKEASRYDGGSLCIMRLAPQDYHRYHSPVDGTVGPFERISGLYYTVNPMAIRSQVDVYGENKREVSPIDSPAFGRVMMTYVGAMLVAGIEQTVEAGQQIQRGDEIGYFKFGGSTIVIVFEPGKVQFDEDILQNSSQAIETLVRVGMRIGRKPDAPAL